ncbi:DUF262 domain-containing protein [Vibrio diabolicus]|uniref:DUF262 domain-containing protein n=1 Tax=Vibrio diabolicus TaxID=50719 RepID=UPI003752B4B6
MTQLTPTQQQILAEIEAAKQNVNTDGYKMSIGEIINLCRDGEMKLDPAFQRLFRWEDEQKTKLIESILIGIPVPEIFVAQKGDNRWHVVDGVQRLSTLLQFAGALEGYEKLVLKTCKYIPSIEGCTWDTLPDDITRGLKRAKLNISIIHTGGTDEAQYELFQRLNTGGTVLSEQEKRNCLILMINPSFFEKIEELKNYPNFRECLTLSEDDYKQELHMELILRMFIGYHDNVVYSEHGPIHKIVLDSFIDKETIRLIKEANLAQFEVDFKKTFDKLKNTLEKESFKKYDTETHRFKGGFNVSAFEMLTIGISKNINTVEQLGNSELKDKIINLYLEEKIKASLGRGVRAIQRFKDTSEFVKEYFSDIK